MRVDRVLFRLVDEIQQVVCAVVAHEQVYRLVFREHDGLELEALRFRHLQVVLDAVFLAPAVRVAPEDEGHGVCPASLELVQVAHREVLVHRGYHAGDAREVCGQSIEHAFHDNRVVVVGLDVERDVDRARGV